MPNISLAEFIIYYNNSFNNVIKRKPIDIRNIKDLNEINLNIIKSMSSKIQDEQNIIKDDTLLLIDNIKVKNKNITINLKK